MASLSIGKLPSAILCSVRESNINWRKDVSSEWNLLCVPKMTFHFLCDCFNLSAIKSCKRVKTKQVQLQPNAISKAKRGRERDGGREANGKKSARLEVYGSADRRFVSVWWTASVSNEQSGTQQRNRRSDNHSNGLVPSCHAGVEMGAASTETT